MAKKNEILVSTGHGPALAICFTGGPKPYLWIGNNDNYGYVPDRSIRKLHRFCEQILKAERKATASPRKVRAE